MRLEDGENPPTSLIDSLEVGVGVAFIHGRSRLKSRVEGVRVESVGR